VNILDADAAFNVVCDFEEPAIRSSSTPTRRASRSARVARHTSTSARCRGHFLSAYGASSRRTHRDFEFANALREVRSPSDGSTRMFYEIVIAPGYEPDALEHLKKKSQTYAS